jgi:hypothetical protein
MLPCTGDAQFWAQFVTCGTGVRITATQRTNHVAFSPTDTREDRIEKGARIVANVAAKLISRGQKSYIEAEDIKASGYAAMIRTLDLPPARLSLEARIAANARRAMVRDFVGKQIREYLYAQAGRGACPMQPHRRGVITPGGDPNGHPHDPLRSHASVIDTRAKERVDRDIPSAQRAAAWRDAFVHHGWSIVGGKRQKRFVSRAEIAHDDWRREHARRWNDIRTSTFDTDLCEYLLGEKLSEESLNRRIARRDQLSTCEYMHAHQDYRWRFEAWAYGWRSTVKDRRTGWVAFRDLLSKRSWWGWYHRIPENYSRYHQRPVLDCLRHRPFTDRNRFRTFLRWGTGYKVQAVRIKGKPHKQPA